MKPINQGATTVGFSCVCEVCSEKFESKTKLFKHLEQHGFEGNNSKPVKVVLLVGWLNELMYDTDCWVIDQVGATCYTDSVTERMELHLWAALYALENQLESVSLIPKDVVLGRPKGYSRGTSCMQRSTFLLGSEPSCHGGCDTFCLQVKRWLGAGGDDEWVCKINCLLPSTVRVLHKVVLSSAGSAELHAENSCSQRRYEYLLPLRLMMPPELTFMPTTPIVRRVQTHRKGTQMEQAIDRDFPLDTPEGQARVHFFRQLKKLLKTFAGRQSYHNFASGGACPEEQSAMRRVDRIYHKEIVTVGGEAWVVFSVSADALLRGQARRMIGLAIALVRGWLPGDYLESAALNASEVSQLPAVPGWGLYIAECKYAFWEAKFPEEKLDPRRAEGGDLRALNEWNRVLLEHIAGLFRQAGDAWLEEFEAECRRITAQHRALETLRKRSVTDLEAHFERSFGCRFVPTRRPVAESAARDHCDSPLPPMANNSPLPQHEQLSAVSDQGIVPAIVAPSKKQKQEKHRKLMKQQRLDKEQRLSGKKRPTAASIAETKSGVEEDVLEQHDRTDEYSRCATYSQVNAPPSDLRLQTQLQFREVLRLLHEAESSGMWPLSSTGRQRVIADDTLVENGGHGGSFTVGCLPRHLPQPKGNAQFPELLRACFRLEAALCPDRPPSSTIAINRHAQFLPHRDSGAGAGQSSSLIVALGDFCGGEVVVEGTAHDIRYRPLQFNGWTQRHWTLPFVGERYSLVWFTPLGVSPEDMFWLKDRDWNSIGN